MTTAVAFENVTRHFGAVRAVDGVTLDIAPGEFFAMLGPSGSGKTTLLKVLAGFEPVSQGRILLDGRDITRVPPEKRNFGLVFQGYALFPHMTVHDNIAYPLRVRRRPRAEIEDRVAALLKLVQLEPFARRKPQALSGGQQQRVALARALVFKPDLLLLDEPMSALDKKLRHDLQEELRAIHSTLGTTFINVTHDQEEAMHMSDRIAVMNQGRVVQYDTAHALYRRPASRFVAEFVGKSNVFAGRIGPGAVFSGPGFTLSVPDRPTGEALVLLRPEDVEIAEAAPPDGRIALPVRVASSTYSGDRALYSIALPGGRIILTYGSARDGALHAGAPVQIAFDARDGILL